MRPVGPATVVARTTLLLVVAVVLQTSLVVDLRVFDTGGDIMLLIAIAAGLAGGAERGAAYGFVAGLTFDLMVTTPFGLSALTYCLVGYAVGTLQGSVLRATRWIPIVAATLASALGVILFVVLGQVVGQDFPFDAIPRLAVVAAVLNAALVLLVTPVVRWAMGGAPIPLGSVLR